MHRATTREATRQAHYITIVHIVKHCGQDGPVSFWRILALQKGPYLAGRLGNHPFLVSLSQSASNAFNASPSNLHDELLSQSASQPLDVVGPAVYVRFTPSFAGRFHRGKRLAHAASCFVELAELGM